MRLFENTTSVQDEIKKQKEDPSNPWVWLTSYSRIPVRPLLIALLTFFSAGLSL
jgi:hypothetical protein